MKWLSKKLTDYIIKSGVVSEESYMIYQYGFQIGIEMLSCFLVCLGIAIYLHMIPEFFVFTGSFILLRTYAGGLHLNSFNKCFICSITVQTLVLFINKQKTMVLPLAWGIILFSSILILRVAPVENINRTLDANEKKHCKTVTIKVLVGLVIFSVCCTLFNLNKLISLLALAMLVVLISQYIGMIKYRIEKIDRNSI